MLTDQVEPIQFKVANKLKWSRKQVTKQEATELAIRSEKLGERSLLDQTKKKGPNLILHRGEENLVLEPSEYGIKNGSIEVSLQKLAVWIEGSSENSVVENQEEQIFVPVRATLQKFGMLITSYVYNETQREIWVTG